MKEYKFKINGKEYSVAVNGIEGNIADVTVNGNNYSVEVEDGCCGVTAPRDASAPLRPHHSAALHGSPSYVAEGGTVPGGSTPTAANSSNTIVTANAPASNAAGTTITSPLPGDVIEVSVKEGDAVRKGQKVAVIEAMKMENDILAECDGTIARVHVTKGDHVDDGANIVTIA